MTGLPRRNPKKLRAEFKRLQAEAKGFSVVTKGPTVDSWVSRANAFIAELASYIGEDDTPEPVVVDAGTFEGSYVAPAAIGRLEAVIDEMSTISLLHRHLDRAAVEAR